jgi:hypothetical protein
MKKRLIQTLLALTVVQAMGQTFIYDQESTAADNVNFNTSLGTGIDDVDFGQSFIPTLSSVGFIRLGFYNVGVPGATDATISVNLWAGGIGTGTLLGTSTQLFLPVQSGAWANFFFSTPVAVNPGTTYYFQPVAVTGTNSVNMVILGSDHYPNGSIMYSGTPISNEDVLFREGVVVPEPTSISLAFYAAAGLLLNRRKISKR